jgi:hypothetical protein
MKRKNRLLALLLVFVMVLGSTVNVYAADPTSRNITIYRTEGSDVSLSRGSGRGTTPRVGQRLNSGYVVSTGTDSAAYFQLDRDSVVQMDENSQVTVASARRRRLTLTVQSGNALVNVGRQDVGQTVQTRVGNVGLTVRGTMFTIGRGSEDYVEIVMLSGEGEVNGISLPAGSAMVVRDDATVQISDARDLGQRSLFTLRAINANRDYLVRVGTFTQEQLTALPQVMETRTVERQERRAAQAQRNQAEAAAAPAQRVPVPRPGATPAPRPTPRPTPTPEGPMGPQFAPVTGINKTSSLTVTTGAALTLTATVTPSYATNQTITWSVYNAGDTGAVVNANIFTAEAIGTAIVRASVAGGTHGGNFTRNFSIVVTGDDAEITEPPTSEPPITEPPTSEPPTSEPPISEPPISEPPVSEPPISEPPTSEPPTSEPPISEPPTSEPPISEPPTSEPPLTEPPLTEPPISEPPISEPAGTAVQPSGAGTSADPFLISEASHLLWMAERAEYYRNFGGLVGYFLLENNITAPADLVIGGGNWGEFNGYFDGNNYTITINIYLPTTESVGLFSYVASYGVVRNLTVDGSVNGLNSVGGIAGHLSGHIENVLSRADVTGGTSVGGIAGSGEDGFIIRSGATGAVNGNENVGGVIGIMSNDGSILRTFSTGDVTGSADNVGGVVGMLTGSTLQNSYATGNVTGATNVGGLAGNIYNANVRFNYSTSSVTGVNNVGGIIGFHGFVNFSTQSNVALNSSVTATETNNAYVARVIGNNAPGANFISSYAYSGMLVNGNAITENDSDSRDGADITIPLSEFWVYLMWNDVIWNFSGELPTLINVPTP